jgi:hypothetical protein
MISSIVKIQISGIPAMFPAADYVGKLQTYQRVIQIGTHSETVVTDNSYRTIADPNYQERTVQAITYRKYLLRIPANEYLSVDLIEFAKWVYVSTQDEIQHRAKVLSVNYTKQEGTELGEYEIIYADINPQNYKNQTLPINNYLESLQLTDEYETDQLVLLTITDSGTTATSSTIDDEFLGVVNTAIGATAKNKFYSELLPEFDVTENKEEKQEVSGVEKVTYSVGARVMSARFYVKTEAKNVLAKYLSRCDTVTLRDPTGERTALERIEPEIKPVGVDLFQIDFKLKYEILNYYPENT